MGLNDSTTTPYKNFSVPRASFGTQSILHPFSEREQAWKVVPLGCDLELAGASLTPLCTAPSPGCTAKYCLQKGHAALKILKKKKKKRGLQTKQVCNATQE